ncbi:unnamed protein product [Blepharisma stoltei]|uniref:FCH domain-containing protein n=1 Tax=Blepharisma stoltei TaxID=1481888 RepID=A0AAU9IPW1_9CILI|nr:unnamed protein product [Blepharisma stoltei]
MSYSELWNKFKEVRVHYRESKKTCDEFIIFLRDKSELDRSYARGLEKLALSTFFELGKGTLDPCLSSLKQRLIEYISLCKTLANQFHTDLALNLRQLLVHQDLLIKDKRDQGKKLVQEREKLIKIAQRAKEKYIKSCKESEACAQSKSRFEIAYKQEEELSKAYQVSIENANAFAAPFREAMDKILSTYQIHEEERMKLLKESLARMVEYEKTFFKCLEYTLDALALPIESFNPSVDLKKWVDDTYIESVIEEIVFEPFHHNMEFDRFLVELKSSHQGDIVKKIIDKCWKGEVIDFDQRCQFSQTIAEPEGKKAWIAFLNEKRNQGQFKIPTETFVIIGELLHDVLTSMLNSSAYNCASQCIILSQTFYYENEGQKNYLQNEVIDHAFWKQEDVWKTIITEAIDHEIKKCNEYCKDIMQNDEDSHERLGEVVVSQLSSYAHIMESFHVPEHEIQQILNTFVKNYNLPDDILITFMA